MSSLAKGNPFSLFFWTPFLGTPFFFFFLSPAKLGSLEMQPGAKLQAYLGVVMLQPHACAQCFRFRILRRTRSFPGRTSVRSLPGGIESVWEQRRVLCKGECSAKDTERATSLPGIGATPARRVIRITRILARPTWRLRYPARHIPARHRTDHTDHTVIRSYGLALRRPAAPPARHRSLQPSEPAPPKSEFRLRSPTEVGILPRKNIQSSPESSRRRTVACFYLSDETMHAMHSFCTRL